MKLILNSVNNDRKELLSKSVQLYKNALSELEKFDFVEVKRNTLNILSKIGYNRRDFFDYIRCLDDARFGSGGVRNHIKYMIIDAQKELSEELKQRAIKEQTEKLKKK